MDMDIASELRKLVKRNSPEDVPRAKELLVMLWDNFIETGTPDKPTIAITQQYLIRLGEPLP